MCRIVFTVAAIKSNQSIHPVTRDQWRLCCVLWLPGIFTSVWPAPLVSGGHQTGSLDINRWSAHPALVCTLLCSDFVTTILKCSSQKCWGLVTGDAGHSSALFEVLQDELCLGIRAHLSQYDGIFLQHLMAHVSLCLSDIRCPRRLPSSASGLSRARRKSGIRFHISDKQITSERNILIQHSRPVHVRVLWCDDVSPWQQWHGAWLWPRVEDLSEWCWEMVSCCYCWWCSLRGEGGAGARPRQLAASCPRNCNPGPTDPNWWHTLTKHEENIGIWFHGLL